MLPGRSTEEEPVEQQVLAALVRRGPARKLLVPDRHDRARGA